MVDLGQEIKKQREAKNITLEELSSQTKISVAVLRDIENGEFDRYQGDEAYVKMYLKKISHVLNMDTGELTQQYIHLTQEIQLEELQKKEEVDTTHNQDVVQHGKKFSFSLPQLTRKPSVYEDQSHVTIIRSVIVLVLVSLVIGVVWFGMYSTRSKLPKPEFDSESGVVVDGDVSTQEPEEPAQKPEQKPQPELQKIVVTKNDTLDYLVKLPTDLEEMDFKIVFGNNSWCELKVDQNAYEGFKAKVYNKGEEVVVKMNANEVKNISVKNGYSKGHKYFINDQELVLDQADETEGVTVLSLTLEKE